MYYKKTKMALCDREGLLSNGEEDNNATVPCGLPIECWEGCENVGLTEQRPKAKRSHVCTQF